jgi:hypothetical protein
MRSIPVIAQYLGSAIAVLISLGTGALFVNADSPPEKKIVDVKKMSAKERAEFGEILIFGKVGGSQDEYNVGKAQCPLCHGFIKGAKITDPEQSPPFGPHFIDFTQRIERLIASPEYKQRHKDPEQPEGFPQRGIATSVIEYLAESNVCPDCYVVPGFGVKGTQDRESKMPKVHKPPISLSVDELIAIDTWLIVHDGKEPPSLYEIEKAYRKFIPESEWNAVNRPTR